jgi:hypothetical protein
MGKINFWVQIFKKPFWSKMVFDKKNIIYKTHYNPDNTSFIGNFEFCLPIIEIKFTKNVISVDFREYSRVLKTVLNRYCLIKKEDSYSSKQILENLMKNNFLFFDKNEKVVLSALIAFLIFIFEIFLLYQIYKNYFRHFEAENYSIK